MMSLEKFTGLRQEMTESLPTVDMLGSPEEEEILLVALKEELEEEVKISMLTELCERLRDSGGGKYLRGAYSPSR